MVVRKKAAPRPDDGDDGSAELMSSFADMMTLLLGFFMILYSMSHMDEKKFYELGKSIASSFKQVDKDARNQVVESMVEGSRQLRAFQMMIAILNLGESQAIEKIEKEYSEKVEAESTKTLLKDGLKSLPAAEKMLSESADDGIYAEIVLPSGAMFRPGSDEVLGESEKKLRQLANVMIRVKSKAMFEVVGHTDSIPPGRGAKFADNWSLSSARAAAVARLLILNGVPGDRVSVVGRSHFEPLFPETDSKGNAIAENRAGNRRVAIRVIKEKTAK